MNRELQIFQRKIIVGYLFFIIVFLYSASLLAQGVSITSYVDKTTIGVDDLLKLTVELSGEKASQISKFELPPIQGLTVTGSSTSSSSSFVVVGGRMTSSVTRSYIYTLKAQSPGTYLIPPLSIQFEGQTQATDPIRITVVEGSTTPPPPVSQQFRQPEPEQETLSDNIFIIADIPKRTIYRGEPLVVRYKIYSRYDLANLSFQSEPNFIGFWKDDLFFASRMNFQRENYQGRLFNSMLLRTIVLYPNQAGNLTIPAFLISADIIVRARSFWDFDSSRKVSLESKPIEIEVKDIPVQGRPAAFSGAVGNFRMASQISETELNVGDPLTITVTISGSGNFKHFDPPPFPTIPFLRVLEPETSTQSDLQGNQMVGSKTIKYPAIVTQDGEFEIPAFNFAWYDPQRQVFSSLTTNPYSIKSHQVDLPIYSAGHSQQDIHAEGFDIFYIYRNANLRNQNLLIHHWSYWFLWLISLLSIPTSFIYGKERYKLLGDRTHLRQRLARKILKKYLKLATEGAKAGDMSFYSHSANGLSNYLTDILKIPRGSTQEVIIATMVNKNFPNLCIERVKNTITRCEEARFKPGGFDKQKINSDYQELISVINDISNCKVK